MTTSSPANSDSQASDLEAFTSIDTGGRTPAGGVGKLLAFVAFSWSVFQLYVSSAVPFWLAEEVGINLIFNGSEVRVIHLAFAMALACLSYPFFKSSPKTCLLYTSPSPRD